MRSPEDAQTEESFFLCVYLCARGRRCKCRPPRHRKILKGIRPRVSGVSPPEALAAQRQARHAPTPTPCHRVQNVMPRLLDCQFLIACGCHPCLALSTYLLGHHPRWPFTSPLSPVAAAPPRTRRRQQREQSPHFDRCPTTSIGKLRCTAWLSYSMRSRPMPSWHSSASRGRQAPGRACRRA